MCLTLDVVHTYIHKECEKITRSNKNKFINIMCLLLLTSIIIISFQANFGTQIDDFKLLDTV
jgi:hypothetical protein